MNDSNAKKNPASSPTSLAGKAVPEQLLANTLRHLGKIDNDPSALRAAKRAEIRGLERQLREKK